MSKKKPSSENRVSLEPRVYAVITPCAAFGSGPLRYETYTPAKTAPARPGAMDAYKLHSMAFGKRGEK